MKRKSDKDIIKRLQNNDMDAVDYVLTSGCESKLIQEFIQNSKLSESVFVALADSDYWEFLLNLLLNPHVKKELKNRILNSSKPGIYQCMVQQEWLIRALDTSWNDIPAEEELLGLVVYGKAPAMWSHLDETEQTRRKKLLTTATKGTSSREAWVTLGTLADSENDKLRAKKIWTKVFGRIPPGATRPLPFSISNGLDAVGWQKKRSYALHPLTSRINLVKISYSGDIDLESIVAANPSLPPCIVAYYVEALFSNFEPLSLALANPVVPSYVWTWFNDNFKEIKKGSRSGSRSEEYKLLLATAAQNHGLPVKIMEKLSVRSMPQVVLDELKKNVCVPKEIKKHIGA